MIVPVKAALAVGKNQVVLMIMTATAASPATASAATASATTTTSHLGSDLGSIWAVFGQCLGSDLVIGSCSKIAVFVSNSMYVDFSPI